MDILGQSALLVGTTSFALGFSTLARNVRNKLFLAFAAFTTVVSFWALAFFMEKIWGGEGFYRFHLLLNFWLAPVALYFIRSMIRIRDRLSRGLLDLSLLLAVGLSIALLLEMDAIPWVRQVIYFAPGTVVLQILQLMWIDLRLKRGTSQRTKKTPVVGLGRRSLIYLGGLLTLALCVMDHVPMLGVVVPSIGNIFLAVYLFFLSQAISQQRLLNLSALLSRFLVLLAVGFTLSIVYSLMVGWIENSPVLFFFNSFIASFLILTLLDPLRALVRYFTERLLTQQNQRLQLILREGQRKLAGIVDMGALFQAILLTTEQMLQPQWAAIYVLRSDGTKYRKVRELHTPANEPLRELLAQHPLIEYCRTLRAKNQLPVVLDQMIESEMDRTTSRLQREHLASLLESLKALGANLLIPLFDEGHDQASLGFVALHVPSPPEPWGSNWGLLPLVYPYYELAARTMSNMVVFVRSREKERLAALGEMAAGLAHEIRNPLGAIKGAAQFLDPSMDKPESKFLKIIIEEADRLNRVVTQFLDYSKPPAADLKTVDLSQLVEKSVEAVRPGVEPRIQLELSRPRPGLQIQAAPEQIQQVILNLIQNSMKALQSAGRNGAGRIRVWVEAERDEASIVVEDNGTGIRKEHLDKLFIPFFTTSPSGTGLGLSISQKIVEAHRGRIEVATEEGRFTRFSVVLPLSQEGEKP